MHNFSTPSFNFSELRMYFCKNSEFKDCVYLTHDYFYIASQLVKPTQTYRRISDEKSINLFLESHLMCFIISFYLLGHVLRTLTLVFGVRWAGERKGTEQIIGRNYVFRLFVTQIGSNAYNSIAKTISTTPDHMGLKMIHVSWNSIHVRKALSYLCYC